MFTPPCAAAAQGYPHCLGSHPIQCHPLAPQTTPAPANCSHKGLLLCCSLLSWCCGTDVLSALCNLLSCALGPSSPLGSIHSKLCCLVLWAGWALWEVKAIAFLAFSASHSAAGRSAGAQGCSAAPAAVGRSSHQLLMQHFLQFVFVFLRHFYVWLFACCGDLGWVFVCIVKNISLVCSTKHKINAEFPWSLWPQRLQIMFPLTACRDAAGQRQCPASLLPPGCALCTVSVLLWVTLVGCWRKCCLLSLLINKKKFPWELWDTWLLQHIWIPEVFDKLLTKCSLWSNSAVGCVETAFVVFCFYLIYSVYIVHRC